MTQLIVAAYSILCQFSLCKVQGNVWFHFAQQPYLIWLPITITSGVEKVLKTPFKQYSLHGEFFRIRRCPISHRVWHNEQSPSALFKYQSFTGFHMNGIYSSHMNGIYSSHMNGIYSSHMNGIYSSHQDVQQRRIEQSLLAISTDNGVHNHQRGVFYIVT